MATPTPQMITANRLLDGEIVYWRDGSWVPSLAEGTVFEDPKSAEAGEEKAKAFVQDNKVVGLYRFDVRRTADGIEPVKEREVIRSRGPSVRADLGKQAGHGPQGPQASEPKHV